MSILIISEKPSSAAKIADALGKATKGAGYYSVKTDQGAAYVVPAVGHLFTLVEKKKSRTYPVFDLEWVELNKASKTADYVAKYIAVIKKLAKEADRIVIACDYDVEGELIGYNIARFLLPRVPAKRMKFSSLTKEELQDAFENLETVPVNKALAGEARHYLDWFFGINLSRALMSAIQKAGAFRLMSIGRVQGPTLAVLAHREKAIAAFVSTPYWQLFANAKGITFTHIVEKFLEKEKADSALENANKATKGTVEKADAEKYLLNPPTPHDLTSLQVDAYNAFGFTPARTLEIAQKLYEAAVISYPRTSSQQLPDKLNLKKIISSLAAHPAYRDVANKLLQKPVQMLKPHNGKKTDPAHPAIHPTGVMARMGEDESKLYDLIVRRFLATFGDAAKRERLKVLLDIGGEKFVASGGRTLYSGWLDILSRYVRLDEVNLDFGRGEIVKIEKLWQEEKQTQPPKRYSPASIVKKLESLNLGTKATRAEVIETLYRRNYIAEKKSIQVTPFGLEVYEALHKHCPKIMSEALTRKFEDEMAEIEDGKLDPKKVIQQGKETVAEICEEFKKHETEIGPLLLTGLNTAQRQSVELGVCKCGGKLVLRKSKFGVFVGCSSYPNCKVTFPLPHGASIVPTEKVCEKCSTPIVGIARKAKRFFQMCLDPKCETKASWAKKTNDSENEVKK